MLYTIIIFVSGIYLSQEYPDHFPSIKTLVINLLNYLKNLRDPIVNTVVQDSQNQSIYERIIGIFW